MKIAYLIMAHRQPSHLARLIKLLSSDRAYFFIHIDRKSRLSNFEELIPENSHVVFLRDEHRINVQWGGFSQVLATLKLMEAALNSEGYVDRYCLISGSDFPIKKLRYIEEQLNTEKEFMAINARLGSSDDNFFCKYVRYYWFADNLLLRKARLSGKIRRKVYDKIDLYQGSQWWSLTAKCVKYIIEFLKQNRDYLDFHKYTVCSDEVFFHSIVKSSPFSKNITHDMVGRQDGFGHSNACVKPNDLGCHYIDWSDMEAGSPKVLDISDLDKIMDSEALFARKFDEEKSKDLLNVLETKICMDL